MPEINFKPQFIPDILSGAKRQTIRRMRKYPIKKNDTLHLYTGLRTKNCKKLKTVACIDVKDIRIDHADIDYFYCIYIDNKKLNLNEILFLALSDGFKSITEFLDFFIMQGLPFIGQIIYWEDIK